MSLLALIPARGGSKGVPRKNIRLLMGKPLIGWTIEAAHLASGVDQVVVSTDDEEIAAVARQYGAEVPFMRPAHLAQDTTPGMDVVFHALDELPGHDSVLLLQPTSPLRTAQDIDAIIAFRRRLGAPAAVSVTESAHHPQWMFTLEAGGRMLPLIDSQQATRRQDLPEVYALNGALYLADVNWLMLQRSFLSNESVGYVMPPERSADIDTPLDWSWVEFLMMETNRG